MSFLSKIKQMMKKEAPQLKVNPIEELLLKMIHPTYASERYQSRDSIIQLIQDNTNNVQTFYALLTKPIPQPRTDALLCLLETLHLLLENQDVAELLSQLLKTTPLYWFTRKDKENLETERLTTENSTSSFFPNSILNQQKQQTEVQSMNKSNQINEKRMKRIEMNKELKEMSGQQQVAKSSAKKQSVTQQVFVELYYSYILRLAANRDLWSAVRQQQYPFQDEGITLDSKMKFLWLYKIQNLMSLKLLEKFEPTVQKIQHQIWKDSIIMQNFVSREIQSIMQIYQKLSESDVLQLYEIYIDALNNETQLDSFKTQSNNTLQVQEHLIRLQLPQEIKDEFLDQAMRTKIMARYGVKSNVKKEQINEDIVLNHHRQRSGCPMLNVRFDAPKQESMVVHNEQESYEIYNPFEDRHYEMRYEKAIQEQIMQDKLQTLNMDTNTSGLIDAEY